MTLYMFDSPKSEQLSDAETETQSDYSHDRGEARSPPGTPRICCGGCPCNCTTCPCGIRAETMSDFPLFGSPDDDAESFISDNGDEGAHGRHEEDDWQTWYRYTTNNNSDIDMTSTASMTAEPSSGEASWYSSTAQSYASIDDLALQDLNHEHIYISTILPLLPVDGPPFPGNRPPP